MLVWKVQKKIWTMSEKYTRENNLNRTEKISFKTDVTRICFSLRKRKIKFIVDKFRIQILNIFKCRLV